MLLERSALASSAFYQCSHQQRQSRTAEERGRGCLSSASCLPHRFDLPEGSVQHRVYITEYSLNLCWMTAARQRKRISIPLYIFTKRMNPSSLKVSVIHNEKLEAWRTFTFLDCQPLFCTWCCTTTGYSDTAGVQVVELTSIYYVLGGSWCFYNWQCCHGLEGH
jgi:hypothetical protein